MSKKADIETTAEAYLELLAARGVEYFFGNAGTDFAPIIEAYARRGAHGQLLPRPITVPHEVPAVAMAHGYAMVTEIGRHTSELQSLRHLVCRLLLEKKKKMTRKLFLRAHQTIGHLGNQ